MLKYENWNRQFSDSFHTFHATQVSTETRIENHAFCQTELKTEPMSNFANCAPLTLIRGEGNDVWSVCLCNVNTGWWLCHAVLFVVGRPYYKLYPPTGSVIRQMLCCIGVTRPLHLFIESKH